DVVVEGQTAVVQEAPQRRLLVGSVRQGRGDRRAVEGDLGLPGTPREEVVDDRRGHLPADRLAPLAALVGQLLLDLEELADQPQRVLGELRLGAQRLEEVAPAMSPAYHLAAERALIRRL